MKPKPLPLALDRKWPRCATPDCDKPAKTNSGGYPRKLCSTCLKRAETAKNTGKSCDAPGCDVHRMAAHRWCCWHYKNPEHRDGPVPHKTPRTHCAKRGHELTPENTGYLKGYRFCRECRRTKQREAWARKKAAA